MNSFLTINQKWMNGVASKELLLNGWHIGRNWVCSLLTTMILQKCSKV